ncbi:MAG: ecotin family protein, partial [Pirellulaceae bacterium]
LMLIGVIAMAVSGHSDESKENMKAYPPAGEGVRRFVLHLPPSQDEDEMKVELQVGRVVEVDSANRYFFASGIEEVSIEGWGFPKYVVEQLGPMAGTRVAVDPSAPKKPTFVRQGGDPYLIRYNSRLPVVVYVPVDAQVRYRIWKADGEGQAMESN